MKKTTILLSLVCIVSSLLSGCGGDSAENAIAVIQPKAGQTVTGTVEFEQVTPKQVRVLIKLKNLVPNQRHGIHVHQFGDCSADDFTSAGGHYNPEGHPHGLPPRHERHAGSFGNIEADKDGVGELQLIDTTISVDDSYNPVLGRSVIVHASMDNGGQPAGNAGPRIGCGVIGIKK